MRALLISMSLCVAACATSSTAVKTDGDKAPAAAAPERMAVVNNLKFDLASCTIKPIETSVNDTIVMAALLSGRPAYGECLVDPKTRGPAADTQVTLKASLSDADVKFEVGSTNLEATGKACIEKSLAALGLKPLAKGAKPVEVTLPYNYSAVQGVKWGVNAASDVVGAVRVAQSGWCECFASLGTNPPPSIRSTLHVTPTAPIEVTMAPGGDATVGACLEGKIKTLNPKATIDVTVPYQFVLTNGLAAQENAEVEPTLQFHQLADIGLAGEVGVAQNVGGREIAAAEFDAAVRRYNAKTSAAGRKELIEKCNAILNVDERIRSSLDGLKGTYERTLKVIETLKPTSPSWEQVGTGVTARLTAAAKDAAGAVEQKKVDAATCQKVK